MRTQFWRSYLDNCGSIYVCDTKVYMLNAVYRAPQPRGVMKAHAHIIIMIIGFIAVEAGQVKTHEIPKNAYRSKSAGTERGSFHLSRNPGCCSCASTCRLD